MTEHNEDKRTINVNAKYTLDDNDPGRRKIAEMLIKGIDIGSFAPGVGTIKITGKKIFDLALERLCVDLEKAEEIRDRKLRKKYTLEELSELMSR